MGKKTGFKIRDLEKAVKASADINRVRILNMLRTRKMCVCEIAFVLGISQPSVSRHLRKLSSAGFIQSEHEGLWTNYYLCPKNAYAENFLKNLVTWMCSDETISGDKKKIDEANRTNLCCL